MLDNVVEKIDEKHYRSLIKWLIYLIHSRPYIMFAVSLLSRFICNLNKYQFRVVKKVLDISR